MERISRSGLYCAHRLSVRSVRGTCVWPVGTAWSEVTFLFTEGVASHASVGAPAMNGAGASVCCEVSILRPKDSPTTT